MDLLFLTNQIEWKNANTLQYIFFSKQQKSIRPTAELGNNFFDKINPEMCKHVHMRTCDI